MAVQVAPAEKRKSALETALPIAQTAIQAKNAFGSKGGQTGKVESAEAMRRRLKKLDEEDDPYAVSGSTVGRNTSRGY